jgi:hypothetical protein
MTTTERSCRVTVEALVMRRRRGVSAAENPKSVHVSIRLDADMAATIDREVERLSKMTPGIVYNRSMIIRMVIAERLKGRRA